MQTLKTWLPAFSGMTCLGFGAGLISIYGFFVEPLSREFGVGVAAINMGPPGFNITPHIIQPIGVGGQVIIDSTAATRRWCCQQ